MSTWPQADAPESTQAQLGDRYVCLLDGTPLNDNDDHWWCEHESEPDGQHETLLAYDTVQDRIAKKQGECAVGVTFK